MFNQLKGSIQGFSKYLLSHFQGLFKYVYEFDRLIITYVWTHNFLFTNHIVTLRSYEKFCGPKLFQKAFQEVPICHYASNAEPKKQKKKKEGGVRFYTIWYCSGPTGLCWIMRPYGPSWFQSWATTLIMKKKKKKGNMGRPPLVGPVELKL